MLSEFGPVISTYTRREAIADGVLVDVTETAREAGIRYPVAITRSVWDTIIIPDPRDRQRGQSAEGRLWDVLWMLKVAARRGGDTLRYSLAVVIKGRRRVVELKSVCGPGDDTKPVITIMLPDED